MTLSTNNNNKEYYDVVVIGAGAAGIAVTASLLKRTKNLTMAIIEPAEIHYYQPGWTMVGAGVFEPKKTVKTIASLLPKEAKWIKSRVVDLEPDDNSVILDNGYQVFYHHLIVCPGLILDWQKIEGLDQTLGKNNVTSNYRYDLASYTWQCVQNTRKGRALFTQPPMPIKCAGAPQKAMYLSSDYWLKNKLLSDIEVFFFNAGDVLFGVKDYVPALMNYIERYHINLNFAHNLVKVDGVNQVATFEVKSAEGNQMKDVEFDMLHVVPPQSAPDFIKNSKLADSSGWLDVDPFTLQHKTYQNIYGLGDVVSTSNAKTAAAARAQAPVVANNVLHDLQVISEPAYYNGYGSCPLTVERGKIVLAEFGYNGKILSTFPDWIINGTEPSRLAWYLKEILLPPVYWRAMLKGYEFLVKSEKSQAYT